jgi:hypothetical protein
MMGDGRDNDAGLVAHGAPQSSSDAIVQRLMPAMLDDQFGQDDGDGSAPRVGIAAR